MSNQHRENPRRVALVSLGCPKNQVDSELMLGQLASQGYEIEADPEDADVLVVNTCSFIDKARAESVDALLDASAWKTRREGRRVIAAGCLVQRSGDELAEAIPELDDLVGLDEIREVSRRLPALDASAVAPPPSAPAAAPSTAHAPFGPAIGLFDAKDPRRRLSPPWTAYVKIAEGCDQSCAFCAIPTFRGRMRSRPLEDLAAEMRALAAEGVVEANLVAQDSTGYGRDIELRDGLAALVRHLDALDEAPAWIRLHYLYPGRISRGLLEALAAARRIAPYVDLPLQHAHPDVLRRMRRPGNAETYLRQLENLRAAMPGAGSRSGFIVGFPGETDEHFATLCEFVQEAAFDAVGVFTYSHEESTSAYELDDDVPAEVKEERKTILDDIAAAASHQRGLERVGAQIDVLVEGESVGRWAGQAPDVDGAVVFEDGPLDATPGTLVRAEIVDAAPHELVARRVSEVRENADECR
jgi:ribosomal protein S12 methylthiotransferase